MDQRENQPITTYQLLENTRKRRGACALALIDPDAKNHHRLDEIIQSVRESDFDAVLVGGSLIMDDGFEERIIRIREQAGLPVLIFPGSSRQLSDRADAILYLSLLSGRNPQYLIGEHVQSAPVIFHMGLETIPTGYILLDGGAKSSVQVMSNTNPLPMEKHDIIMAHALAGQYLGMKYIFFEAGSGAHTSASPALVKYVSRHLDIPLLVGGGIRTAETAGELVSAGAGYIVLGNILEKTGSKAELPDITRSIHFRE